VLAGAQSLDYPLQFDLRRSEYLLECYLFKFIPASSRTAISALQHRWSLLRGKSLFGAA
jgi:hypothetical protein